MAELATISMLATLASGAVTAVGTIAAGNAAAATGEMQKQAAEFEAKQLDMRAKDELAQGQKQMLQLRRQKNLALSSLQSRSAASGFSATDPTSLALADEISQYGTLQEQTALYGGEAGARDARLAAAGRRYEGAAAYEVGKARRTGAYLSAGGTILGSLSSMGSKFQTPKRYADAYGNPSRYGSIY